MAVMARRTTTTPPPPEDFEENIVDIDVTDEMRGSFLEYAYSVIYQRALPDARDGLKPVQRRILYQMSEMGLRADRPHVKCARVVGDVMGRLHPHGDSAIYDALVRMAQPFAMRLPLIDGHGNFGSLGGDDAPAAMRYTEARLSAAAMEMTASLDENTVDFIPNYDGQEVQPEVLPSALPNLLVNGAAGIAVGMATNMAPHNLGEVVAAARHLIAHPDADLDTLMRFIPGPDLPTGGRIVGLDGVRDAYASGRGIFRTRATVRVEKLTPRRTGLVVTELPYGVGPEKVVARIKDLVQAKKLNGIADLKDLTDMNRGLHLVIEVRNGFVPEAVLDELYRLTPMEETFGINNVALVDGQPRILGLRELLQIYVDHRIDVVRRRTAHRRDKRTARLHLVDGLLIALLNIDEVIQVIRESDDAAAAKERLMAIFELSEIQAQYILDTPLRRLTRFDKLELERERETLQSEIAELTEILESESRLRQVVSDELASVSERFSTPRRTVLLEGSGAARTAAVPLEVPDEPCTVLLSADGLLARTASGAEAEADTLALDGAAAPEGGRRGRARQRAAHDVITGAVTSTARGTIGIVTSRGRLIRLGVLELPALPPSAPVPRPVGRRGGERLRSTGGRGDRGRRGRGRGGRRRPGAGYRSGGGQAGRARLPAERGRVRGHLPEGRRPGGRGRPAPRRAPRPGVHHQRCPAPAVRRRRGAAAGPRGGRHGRHPAGRGRHGDLVRHGRPGRRRRGARRGPGGRPGRRPARRPGRDHGGRLGERAAGDGGHGQGHPVRGVPGQGPGHRRGPLPPLPQGGGHAGPGLGRPRPRPGATAAGAPVELPPAAGRRDGSGERVRQLLAAVGGTAPPA